MIAVIDAGTGNLRSVVRALEAASPTSAHDAVTVTRDPDVVRRADRLVMPGQGAFGDCAQALAAGGGALAEAVRESIATGRSYLGICLGLQVLFDRSDEAPGATGLGVIRGCVRKLACGVASSDDDAIKIPHVGWNRVHESRDATPMLGHDGWYYFVHSYVVVPDDPRAVAGRTEHGESFVSAVRWDNVLAVQFHPEKSQSAGLELLRRWQAGA